MDHISGIADAAAFEADLNSELSRATRYGRPLSICLFDLVGLDDVAGPHRETVLEDVAGVIQTVRASDAAYHLGGVRFALVLPETNATVAELVAGRLAMRVATSSLDVGLRWGIAPALAPKPEPVLAHAEAALRAASAAAC